MKSNTKLVFNIIYALLKIDRDKLQKLSIKHCWLDMTFLIDHPITFPKFGGPCSEIISCQLCFISLTHENHKLTKTIFFISLSHHKFKCYCYSRVNESSLSCLCRKEKGSLWLVIAYPSSNFPCTSHLWFSCIPHFVLLSLFFNESLLWNFQVTVVF